MPVRDTRKVRMPAVAGQFYDGNALALRRQLCTAEAALPEKTAGKTASGVILPHAGYVFSMPTALRTLREAAGGSFRRAVLLAPSHRVAFRGVYRLYIHNLRSFLHNYLNKQKILPNTDKIL